MRVCLCVHLTKKSGGEGFPLLDAQHRQQPTHKNREPKRMGESKRQGGKGKRVIHKKNR